MSSTDQPTTPAQPTPPPAYGPPPTTYTGAVGQTRGTGISMLLYIVTLSIYGFVYYFKTHDEMKKHSGQGLGGAVALILAIFVGFVLPFTMASEVGNLYKRAGREAPVSGVTGLWILLPLVGAIVWFVKTNGALNAYWESLGAPKA